ncbi:MAG: DUF1295 domain-containing protein, partial [Pedosphaera sp.]|nr:DUF1295 domain-containing protein [Pedosphaera sp.]
RTIPLPNSCLGTGNRQKPNPVGRPFFPAFDRGISYFRQLGNHEVGRTLTLRWYRHQPAEDVRYAKLRADWGRETHRRMFWFYQLQGALQVFLSIPFLITSLNTNRSNGPLGLGLFEWAGVLLWFIGIAGETLADRQLATFRADATHRGQVCQSGLWKYSRHPNYFFETVIWLSFAVVALGSPLGFFGLLAPIAIGHFLINVTGIPMTEELSLKSKGEAYRAYQRTTSAFFPWFKYR